MPSDLLEYSSIESLWIPPWFSGKGSTCSAGDVDSIPGPGRSPGEGNGNPLPLRYSWASLKAQLIKNPPAMWETWARSLSWEDPQEKGKATHSSILAWRIPWIVSSLGPQRVRAIFTSILAWRIPWTEEPGGL